MSHPGFTPFLTPAEINAVCQPLERASLLPGRVYADPAIYEFETKRLFMRSWLPLAREDELPAPGTYFSRVIADEPVVITRDETGMVRAFSNVCRHRNRQVAEGAGTCKNGRITCPYHGWSYGIDGKLAGAPHMRGVEGFVKETIGLPELAVDLWQGFIFVNFDTQAEKLSPQLGKLDDVLNPLNLKDMVCQDFDRYTASWNWKATLENFTEAYHQMTIHPGIDPLVPGVTTTYEDVDGPYNLFWIPTAPGVHFQSILPPVPGTTFSGIWVVNVFPFFHLLIDDGMVMWLDWAFNKVDEHEIIWRMMIPAATAAAPDFAEKKAEIYKMIKQVWDEDVYACSGIRTGAKSRFAFGGRMSLMERSVHQFQKWIAGQYQQG